MFPAKELMDFRQETVQTKYNVCVASGKAKFFLSIRETLYWYCEDKFYVHHSQFTVLISRTYYRSYRPYPGYPADTRMLWRIEYVISSGALIPSPVWGFQTRAFPDFKVEKVLVPSYAFSGQTFEVSWTVRNIGKVGNVLTTWYDAVFIGKSTEFNAARFVTK